MFSLIKTLKNITVLSDVLFKTLRLVTPIMILSSACYLASSQSLAQADSSLPDLGNAASPILSPLDELELGRSVLGQLQASLKISNDNIINDYLESVGFRIVATFSHASNKFNFFTVIDPRINAFALPGGFIGVNSGLILNSESESELAGVLAHEVAHVKQRHIARMYEHMGRVKISTIAGLLASIVLATQNTQAGTGAMAATLAGGQQAMINFTREHEREADFIGIQALAKAGFDPMGMPSFFQRMYQDTRFYGRWIPEYLLTHPLSSERLMASKSRAQDYPYKQIADSLQFHLIKARLHVATAKTPQEATQYFKQALENGTYRNRLGTLYGLALAYLQEGKPNLAKPAIDELLSLAPNEPLFLLVNAQLAMNQQQPNTAIQLLKKALQTHPNHYALTTNLCSWLILQKEDNEAIRTIKKQMHYTPDKIELYHLLTNAYVQANQTVQAHIAQAQALKLQGDYRSAIRQLTMAKKLNNITDREARQIDAQISEIQPKA